MRKLYASEIEVLSRLIFPEPYDVLLEETGLPPGALRDDLITLINFRLIEVWRRGQWKLIAQLLMIQTTLKGIPSELRQRV